MLEETNILINTQFPEGMPDGVLSIARHVARTKIRACLHAGAISTIHKLIKVDIIDEGSKLAQESLNRYLQDAYCFPAATANMEREASRAAQEAALEVAITCLETIIDCELVDEIASLLTIPISNYASQEDVSGIDKNISVIASTPDNLPAPGSLHIPAECRRKAQIRILEAIDTYLCTNHADQIRQSARESLVTKLECITQETTILTLSDEIHRRTRIAAELAARTTAQQSSAKDLSQACFKAAQVAAKAEFDKTFDSLLKVESFDFISPSDKQLLLDTTLKLAESIAQDTVDRKLLATVIQQSNKSDQKTGNEVPVSLIFVALSSLLGILIIWFATPMGTSYLKPFIHKTFPAQITDQLYPDSPSHN